MLLGHIEFMIGVALCLGGVGTAFHAKEKGAKAADVATAAAVGLLLLVLGAALIWLSLR